MPAEENKISPPILKNPIARILEYIDRSVQEERRFLIALAGLPGSGKSTVAGHWETEVTKQRTQGDFFVLGMDGFHLTKQQLSLLPNPEEAVARRGAPFTFDPQTFICKMQSICTAMNEKDVFWPGFQHSIGDPVPDEVIIPKTCRVILVEGIYTLFREGIWLGLENYFDESWFFDTDMETSMKRVSLRHQKAWNMSPEQAKNRAENNDKLNCAYISPCRKTADFIILPN